VTSTKVTRVNLEPHFFPSSSKAGLGVVEWVNLMGWPS